MSRHECIKMFELVMRLLFIIYWQISGTRRDIPEQFSFVFDEYNEFMQDVEFRRKS